jgi:hypothetical protein
MKPIAITLVTAALVHVLVAYPPTGSGEMSGYLRDYLEKNIGLTGPEIQSVIAARPVAKLLATNTKDEVAIFGIVKIHAPQELFIEKFRNIEAFERGPGVQGTGRFHSPPMLNDVTALPIDNKVLKEISDCRPGDCAVKLSDRAMQSLRRQINWSSPQAASQARAVIRQAFVDYVANYQKIGDEALSIYNDQDKPQSIRDGFRRLLQNSTNFFQYDWALANYLQKYPREKPSDTEDIFYWQKAEFGLKPIVRASHLVIHRNQQGNFATYAIASKMLFASHYFRSALELKHLIPDPAAAGAKSFYLVCLNRSFVDGLTGVKGALIRGTVTRRSRQALAGYLADIKRKTEAADGPK